MTHVHAKIADPDFESPVKQSLRTKQYILSLY